MSGINPNKKPIAFSDLNSAAGYGSSAQKSLSQLRTWFNTNSFKGGTTINSGRSNHTSIPSTGYDLSDFWDTATFVVTTRVQAETKTDYNTSSDGEIAVKGSGVVTGGVYRFSLAGGTVTSNKNPNTYHSFTGLNPTATVGPGKNTRGTGSGGTTQYNLKVEFKNSGGSWVKWDQSRVIIGEAGNANCYFYPRRDNTTGGVQYKWSGSTTSTAGNSDQLSFTV